MRAQSCGCLCRSASCSTITFILTAVAYVLGTTSTSTRGGSSRTTKMKTMEAKTTTTTTTTIDNIYIDTGYLMRLSYGGGCGLCGGQNAIPRRFILHGGGLLVVWRVKCKFRKAHGGAALVVDSACDPYCFDTTGLCSGTRDHGFTRCPSWSPSP